MMKEKRVIVKAMLGIAIVVLLVLSSSAQPVAFPNAEGYGKYTTGGRGTLVNGNQYFIEAQVIEVTNLEDYDDGEEPIKGSFRWALTQQDTLYSGFHLWIPTTIIFRVGGVINLKRDIKYKAKHLTIAGQTAPGDGICFSGRTLSFNESQNLIVRYIRSRPGDLNNAEVSAFRIENGGNFIIDHCTFSWAIEETTHFSASNSISVQWCIVSESLYNSIHKKGARGYATQWGGEYASYHHNLLAHHNSRMPRINGSSDNDIEALVDYRNNVNYNWGSSNAFYGGEWENTGGKGFCHTNVVNNYFIPGPATSGSTFASPSYNRDNVPVDGYAKWYFDGNVMVGNEAKTNDNWLGVSTGEVGGKDNIYSADEFVKIDGSLEQYDNYTQSAEEAYVSVLENVGASFPTRDAHDLRLIQETKGEIDIVRYEYTTNDDQKTPLYGVASGLIDTQVNLVSPEDRIAGKDAWSVYETIPSTEAPVDTDHDGMPDDWETTMGLNPTDGTDFRILTPSGYTYLEGYLSELIGLPIDLNKVPDAISTVKVYDLNVYPNPVSSQLNIVANEQIVSVKVFDLSGRIVLEQTSNDISILNVETLKSGYYLVNATSGSGNVFKAKVLKQ